MTSHREEKKPACLYIVATPIGNLRDITLRALDTLRSADAVICEERRTGSTLLKRLEIDAPEIIELNEHNEKQEAPYLLQRLLQGESLALISDCGTPVFADPGQTLIRLAAESGVRVVPVPGASSLMAALSVLDIDVRQFVFGGFLPREKDERQRRLEKYRAMKYSIILMDTPYRLAKLLQEIETTFGKERMITLACSLTQDEERIYRGAVQKVRQELEKEKAEFILIIQGSNERKSRSKK